MSVVQLTPRLSGVSIGSEADIQRVATNVSFGPKADVSGLRTAARSRGSHSARAPLWRISRYDGFQLRKIDELVGLSSELVGDHGRLRDEA